MFQLMIWIGLLNLVYGQSAQLTNLTVTCNENGMQVSVEFDSPFNGIIYSKNYFKDDNCRFVKSNSGEKLISFLVKKENCGLIENILEPAQEGKHEYRNTIIIQKHSEYQSRFDSAKTIICTWFNLYRTSVTQKPIIVGSLNEEEHFQVDNMKVLIDVREGMEENPFKQTIKGIMKIGQKLTISVFLTEANQLFDIQATNCSLYDSNDFVSSRKISLTNEEGCSMDSQLFDGFKKIDNVQKDEYAMNLLRNSEENEKIIQSNVILTGNLNLIKFPEVTYIYVKCNISICKSKCDSKCHPPFRIEASTTPNPPEQSSDLKLTTTTPASTSPTWIQADPTSTTTQLTTTDDVERETATEHESTATSSETVGDSSESTKTGDEITDLTTAQNEEETQTITESITTLTTNEPFEYKYVKKRLHLNKSLEELRNLLNRNKLNYNHNGLIMSGVDNSTIILLAKVQAREQKRSLERKELDQRSNRSKLTRSIIDNYLKNRLINRTLRQNSNSRTVIIDQPDQSLARVTIDFGNELIRNLPIMYRSNRMARLMKDSESNVLLDHLVLATKSFSVRKFVQEGSNQTELDFQVPANGCGSERVFSEKSSEIMENVLIIQNDSNFQEDGDIARLVACRHSYNRTPDLMSRRVIFKPFMVDNLNVISVPVEDGEGDRSVDVWIDITSGVFPDTEPLEGPVKIGDNLTLAIYVKDSANSTDIRVKDCYAYDNIKSAKNNIKPSQLQLTEENGCPLRENLLSVWRRTTNTMDTGATMIAFNNLKAFKFPEKDSVFLACNIDLCRENCTERCELEPVNPDEEPPMDDETNNANQPPQEQGLGSDYEDPNNVGGFSSQGFRGSIASNRRPNNPQPQQPQRNRPGNQQPPRNRPPQQQRQPPNNRQQPPSQQRNRNQPQGPSPRPQQQQQRQPQRNGPQQQRQPPPSPPLQQQQQRQSSQRGRNRPVQPTTASFNVRIQHKQNQLQAQSSSFDQQSNLQSIEQSSTNNGSPPEVIEQQANLSQGSIARSRPQGRQGKNSRTIARSRKSGLFGPPQQFSPQPQFNGQSMNNAPQLLPPSQPQQQQSPNSLPLPSPTLERQPNLDSPSSMNRSTFSNIQTNDLQSNDLQSSPSSGQLKFSAPQHPNRLRARKVIRKKAKASSFLNKNSLPLAAPDTLMSSASESVESRHRSQYHYIPVLPVDSDFGTRLSSRKA